MLNKLTILQSGNKKTGESFYIKASKPTTMKKALHRSLFVLALLFTAGIVMAQTALAPDQNPDYAVSRARYMKIADSVNTFQGTTSQETYKAIDFLADKAEARAQRREFRQQLRMERARNGYYGYNNDWYYPSMNFNYGNRWGRYNNFNNFYSPYRFNRRSNFNWGLNFGWGW